MPPQSANHNVVVPSSPAARNQLSWEMPPQFHPNHNVDVSSSPGWPAPFPAGLPWDMPPQFHLNLEEVVPPQPSNLMGIMPSLTPPTRPFYLFASLRGLTRTPFSPLSHMPPLGYITPERA